MWLRSVDEWGGVWRSTQPAGTLSDASQLTVCRSSLACCLTCLCVSVGAGLVPDCVFHQNSSQLPTPHPTALDYRTSRSTTLISLSHLQLFRLLFFKLLIWSHSLSLRHIFSSLPIFWLVYSHRLISWHKSHLSNHTSHIIFLHQKLHRNASFWIGVLPFVFIFIFYNFVCGTFNVTNTPEKNREQLKATLRPVIVSHWFISLVSLSNSTLTERCWSSSWTKTDGKIFVHNSLSDSVWRYTFCTGVLPALLQWKLVQNVYLHTESVNLRIKADCTLSH